MKNKELIFSARKKDFRVDFYRAEGKGGQNVNKRDTACRITHLESGISAYCQEHRTQLRNKKEAFKKVAKLLVDHYCKKDQKKRYAAPQKTTRTYNENIDLVVDHESGMKYSYKKTVGKGDISQVIEDRIIRCLTKEN